MDEYEYSQSAFLMGHGIFQVLEPAGEIPTIGCSLSLQLEVICSFTITCPFVSKQVRDAFTNASICPGRLTQATLYGRIFSSETMNRAHDSTIRNGSSNHKFDSFPRTSIRLLAFIATTHHKLLAKCMESSTLGQSKTLRSSTFFEVSM